MIKSVEVPYTKITQVVRVAVNNNFNCTSDEWKQLEKINNENPNSIFFINCNVKTPRLVTINDHPFKAVITLNPDITINHKLIDRFLKINSEKVAFVRIKYIPESPEIKSVISTMANKDYVIVVTLQRWNKKESLQKYTDPRHYQWKHTRHRLFGEALQEAIQFVDSFEDKKVFLCDRLGAGCSSCRLCSFLPTGLNLNIASINLSKSGICRYNCPDCYAKVMQHFLVGCEYNPINFDVIKRNVKQAGRSEHIREALKKMEV